MLKLRLTGVCVSAFESHKFEVEHIFTFVLCDGKLPLVGAVILMHISVWEQLNTF